MTAITIDNPFPFFTNTDGKALDSGKIYIGVAGLDAKTNPITAYWDDALTITAAQPIRTVEGYPDNSGSPSNFFTASDFSITIEDSTDVLIYSKLRMNANELALFNLEATLFDDFDDLKADTTTAYANGTILRTKAERFSYEVVDPSTNPISESNPAGYHVITDGGVKLDVITSLAGYDLRAFGNVGDGVTVNTTTIDAWIDATIANNEAAWIPDGEYVVGTLVARTLASTLRASIRGAGSNVSRFIIPATNIDGFLNITGNVARDHEVWFEGFSVTTQGNANIGIRFKQFEGGNQHRRNIICRDVVIRGENGTTDYFTVPFDFTGTWRPLIDNCQWSGPFIGVDESDSSPRFDSAVALVLDGCYDWTVKYCYFWGSSIGIRDHAFVGNITGITNQGGGVVRATVSNGPIPFSTSAGVSILNTTDYNGNHTITRISDTEFDFTATFNGTQMGICGLSQAGEAFRATRNIINGCKVVLDQLRTFGREPIGWIDDNHGNYRDDGWKLDGCRLLVASGNQMYNEDSAQEYSGTPHDFALNNVSDYDIHDNIMHFGGNPDRIGVFVQADAAGDGDNGLIHHNQFTGTFATAVRLNSGVAGVTVGPNVYSGTITTNVDDVDGANTIIDGGTETTGSWTPALSFGGASTGITYLKQTGSYQITGNLLSYAIEIEIDANGAETGNAEISLPTSIQGTKAIQVNLGFGNFSLMSNVLAVTSPTARPISATSLRLFEQLATATQPMTNVNFTATSRFVIVGQLHLA